MPRLVPFFISCLLLGGCYGTADGVEVPQDEIYFPTGVAMDDGGRHLFVVSSDFDLQYNGGAVQSYDLDLLYRALPRACSTSDDCAGFVGVDGVAYPVCGSDGLCLSSADSASPCQQGDRADADRLLFPGRCNPISTTLSDLLISKVKIGAFATDALLRTRPLVRSADPDAASGVSCLPDGGTDQPPARLFVPVRGDQTLHWIDVDSGGGLDCGQRNNAGACDAAHRAGDDPDDNTRRLTLNAEPFAIDADQRGVVFAVTNQTTGTASLFVNEWNEHGPRLDFALSSSSIPQRPAGVVSVPAPQFESQDCPGSGEPASSTFLMTFRNSPQVRLFQYAADSASSPLRPFLADGGGVAFDANSVGNDSRGIALDASARRHALERCAEGDQACRQSAALVPLDVYVANRSPASLLIGRTQPPSEYPAFFQTLPLTAGPSRIVVGRVQTPSGDEETRVFVVCFDSRRIFVYDPQRSRIETEILTGRGPHAVAIDTARRLLYVGHFTDSYVGVYSLNLASPATYGTLLGTLGTPKAPRASK